MHEITNRNVIMSSAGGRQRRQIVYVDHIAIDSTTSRSPPFTRKAARAESDPPDSIVSTPTSDIATPASCGAESRSRRKIHDSATIITGMNEFRITPFVAVV